IRAVPSPGPPVTAPGTRTVFSAPAEPESPSWSGAAMGMATAFPAGAATASTAATAAGATIDRCMTFLPMFRQIYGYVGQRTYLNAGNRTKPRSRRKNGFIAHPPFISCSAGSTALALVHHEQEGDSLRAQFGARNPAARGAGRTISRLRALDHHAPCASG